MSRQLVTCPSCGKQGVKSGLLGGACHFCGKTAAEKAKASDRPIPWDQLPRNEKAPLGLLWYTHVRRPGSESPEHPQGLWDRRRRHQTSPDYPHYYDDETNQWYERQEWPVDEGEENEPEGIQPP